MLRMIAHKIAPAAIALILLAGCLTARYPSQWARPELVVEGCPDISGTYLRLGQSAYAIQNNNSNYIPLTDYFFETEHGGTTHLAFSMPDRETIVVEQRRGDDVLQTRELSLDEHYTCSEGKIWIPDGGLIGGGAFPIFVVGAESRKIGFVKTNDGSLLGEVLAKGVAVAVVVPFGGSEHDYLLWTATE